MGCHFDELRTYQLAKMRFSVHHLLHALLVTLLPLSVPATPVHASKTYVPHACYPQSFETKTAYETNLHSLISELTSQITINNGFKRIKLGQNAEDSVTGYALCRGDVNQSACSECLNFSTTQLLHDICPGRVGAIAWYDNCMLKYSPPSALNVSVMDMDFMYDPQSSIIDVSNLGAYFKARSELLSVLTEKASVGSLTLKFSVGNINFTASDKIYALMQCLPDLNAEECNRCLNVAAEFVLHPVQKWRASTSDCDVRVAPTQFYDTSVIEQGPYSLPPVTRNDVIYAEGNTHRYVVAIIILTICCIVLLATVCIFLCLMWPKKKIQSINDRTSATGLQTVRVDNAGSDQRRDLHRVEARDARPTMEIPMLAGQNRRTSVESNYSQDETSHTWILKTPVDHPNPR